MTQRSKKIIEWLYEKTGKEIPNDKILLIPKNKEMPERFSFNVDWLMENGVSASKLEKFIKSIQK